MRPVRQGLLVLAFLLLAPAALGDHPTGAPVYADEVGPYLVEARVALTEASENRFIEYSVSVQDAETSERVQDASVTATAITPDGERGPFELGGLGDAWTIAIPLDEEGRVDWRMEVRVTSSLGEARFGHPLRVDPDQAAGDDQPEEGPEDGGSTLPVVGGVTAAVVLAVALLVRRSRGGAKTG